MFFRLLPISLVLVGGVSTQKDASVVVRTESGWVRGTQRVAQNGVPYASFRGIPYAKQPLGELRFKELQPVTPWDAILDATTDGPACYQHNVFFGPLMSPQGFSESCIHVNVHVPMTALPNLENEPDSIGLPIFVFCHGGGWISGSGDGDMNGPEYLIGKDVIVITFNYRLDVIGFLCLETPKIPGNNGLRDHVTLLKWVQRNAPYFGGNPDEVTLSGESAGSNNAHLLSLSPLSKGLFKRLWLMTGTAIPRNFISQRLYAKQLANTYLTYLGLNGTDYDEVHAKLVEMPITKLHEASKKLLPLGLTTFMPVQESSFPGVTAIIADDPEVLLAEGKGDDIPTVVGYNSHECETFRTRIIDLDLVGLCQKHPSNAVPAQLLFALPENVTSNMATQIGNRYFGGKPTLENFIQLCSESYFAEPSLKFVRDRATRGGAPVYLYKFSYEADHSVLKTALNLTFNGAGHIEDMNHVLKVNSYPTQASTKDDDMKDWMSDLVANFVKTGSPSLDNSWPAQLANQSLQYQEILTPYKYRHIELYQEDRDFLEFFDNLADTK